MSRLPRSGRGRFPASPSHTSARSSHLERQGAESRGLPELRDRGGFRSLSDGAQIVYTRRWVNQNEDKMEASLWVMNADGSKNRFLTKGSDAEWSPDGTRIAYIAEGDPKGPQVFVRWMTENAATQITQVQHPPSNLRWSPDGKQIALTMLVPKESKWDIPLPKPPEGAKWTKAPAVVDRLHYRQDRVGYTEAGFTHLFVVPADGGTPRALTSGDWNVGARFDGMAGTVGLDWTPDGRTDRHRRPRRAGRRSPLPRFGRVCD